MSIRIYPYKLRSRGARALAKRLGVLITTPKQIRKHKDFGTIINWGSAEEKFNGTYINTPAAVANAQCKAATCTALGLQDVPTPPHTADMDTAREWWGDGKVVVCRQLLRASQGRGIVLAARDLDQPIVRAPLYTLYVKKQDEYRVHCFRGDIIDIQMKRKRKEMNNEEVNYQIRNAHAGWVFCRSGVDAPAAVRTSSISAVAALGLDFGGVDVGWNQHGETASVYEVNTAPGIEGTTLDKYYEAFAQALPEIRTGAFKRRRSMV